MGLEPIPSDPTKARCARHTLLIEFNWLSAGHGDRTRMSLSSAAFKAAAYTYSTTPAGAQSNVTGVNSASKRPPR
jgi:hypothetical protein